MEEDIEILSEMLIHGEDKRQALENLIKGYRELEKENANWKKINYNAKLNKHITEEYIAKSKIKEKIERLEKEKEETYTRFLASNRNDEKLSTKGKMLEGSIQALQELLEEE